MPRRGQGQGRSRSRGRGKKNPPPRPSTLDFTFSDEECPSSPVIAPARRSTRRSRTSRPLVDISINLIGSDVEEYHSVAEPTPQNTRPRRRQTQTRRNPSTRPTVISLDVTYSSDELDDAPQSSPEKAKDAADLSCSFIMTPSPEPPESDVESNTSDDANKEEEKPAETTEEKKPENLVFTSSDEDEDLFFVDYNLKREKALKAACKEIKQIEQKSTRKPDNDLLCLDESGVVTVGDESPKRKSGDDLDLSLLESATKLPKYKRIKKSKKIAQAQKQLKQVSEELSKLQANGTLEGDVSILSEHDDDESEDENITLFIKWESGYVRWPVRQFQKFSSVYREIADRFSLNVDQVLLCHDDKVITQEACPKDLNLRFGDIIECGVQSRPTIQVKETLTKHGPNSIPLKVQSSDRKGTVTIYIERDSKMLELMHRYAEEKNVKVASLHFKFDGETLDPSDTPETLDLEGEECIDVFTK